MVAGEVGWCTIDGYRVDELVREIIRRARACRWKPHAALFKLNPVRIIIGGQLGPSRLIPRDRICEYKEEKRSRAAEDARGSERKREIEERPRIEAGGGEESRVIEKRVEGKKGAMRAGEAVREETAGRVKRRGDDGGSSRVEGTTSSSRPRRMIRCSIAR